MIVAAIFIALAGSATETPKMDVVKTDDGKAWINITSEKPVPLEMILQNMNGEIFYYKKSEKSVNAYKDVFNFANMPKGKYTLSMNYGSCSVNRELNITKNGISVGPLIRLYEPYFSIEDGMVNISFLNIAQKKVSLEIYRDGNYITRMSLGKNMNLRKKIDISNLERGKYKFVLTDWFKNHLYVVQK